jgi:UV DNA damage endonuclease
MVAALDGPADLMLEAKDKDLALFSLRREASSVGRATIGEAAPT